jgi:ABC-type antimicrobial peptide transport system permease subunit
MLIDFFGAMGVLLAAAGMYGVVSRAVGRRRRELGIRIALGATARSVIALVLSSTFGGLVAGITAGAIGALATSRFIGAFLYGVPASDPWTYAAVGVLLALVTLGASWIPARGASRTHPATVLRSD